MKNLFKPSIIIILLFSGYCQKQKIITNIGDAKKIEINQSKFVGKPLKYLLAQIGPKIKSAIGNPDDDSKNRTKLIQLYFVDKEEFLTRNNKNDTPTSISVVLAPAKVKKLPLSGSTPWTEQQVNEYGDMIIIRVWISGKN